ncbi:MAG: malate dehydrogenase [Legionellales bacterium]|nr:malate dehydrogenase [Legionellales bacterium]|tara:strand:+ start:1704 stop:2687 length:984 start_codon:yes stop_codon:yes gene_type:complete
MTQRISVALTGAAGQISYAFIFRLLSGQVFGDASIDLRLIDLPHAMPALRGLAMEIEDCQFDQLDQLTLTDDLAVGFTGAQWIVCVGSAPRKQGMERQALLKVNGTIFVEQGQAIDLYASDDVKVLVVGNPCNTNALIAMHHAPRIPSNQFFAMTMLDQHRAESQLIKKTGIDVTSADCMIFGNHSSTQYPHYNSARINGLPASQFISDQNWVKDTFVPMIQTRGAEVIKARGASSAASAANGIVSSLCLLNGRTRTDRYSMVVCSNGAYGSPEGLMVSLPCMTDQHGHVSVVEGIDMSEYDRKQIQVSYDELQVEYNMVKELGLIA